MQSFTAAPAWTTEWQYNSARPLLSERADLIVWLDLPFARGGHGERQDHRLHDHDPGAAAPN